jgi:hypothetical protein
MVYGIEYQVSSIASARSEGGAYAILADVAVLDDLDDEPLRWLLSD